MTRQPVDLPPCDLVAERRLVTALLFDSRLLARVPYFQPADCVSELHRRTAEAVRRAHVTGERAPLERVACVALDQVGLRGPFVEEWRGMLAEPDVEGECVELYAAAVIETAAARALGFAFTRSATELRAGRSVVLVVDGVAQDIKAWRGRLGRAQRAA